MSLLKPNARFKVIIGTFKIAKQLFSVNRNSVHLVESVESVESVCSVDSVETVHLVPLVLLVLLVPLVLLRNILTK